MTERHAEGPGEHALCGLAIDAFESGDHPEPVEMAKPGQQVTCEICRQHLAHVRANFAGNRAKAQHVTTQPKGEAP